MSETIPDGTRVIAPDDAGEGEVEATVAAQTDPDDAVLDDDGRRVDGYWIRYDDGTTAKWPRRRVRTT